MDTRQAAENIIEAQANRATESGLSEKVRPLFVAGCPRSGTTAFADYLNQHPEILICRERYRRPKRITRDLFSFERILDYKPDEMKQPPQRNEAFLKYHMELLAGKDPGNLKWVGDKYPGYVKRMGLLAANDPGARFIVLYRPIEEVAESWEARSKNPDDHWLKGRDGFELAVQSWNRALRKTREFIENSPTPRLLIVSYHDFFYQNEAVAPMIARFLEVDFDERMAKAWQEASVKFENRRRRKQAISGEQRSFIQEHADRTAEAWVLDRIDRQRREPGLYIEESREAALASLGEMEARAWRLQQRIKTLEHNLVRERRKNRQLKKSRNLRVSTPRRLLNRLNRIRTRAKGS